MRNAGGCRRSRFCCVCAAACRGARFLRVHEVAAARQALLVADAILRAAPATNAAVPMPGEVTP